MVKKEKYFLTKEKEGKAENNYVAEYCLSQVEPEEVEGWEIQEIEVNICEKLNHFAIVDNHVFDRVYGNFFINSDGKSIQKVINMVRSISGYNEYILMDILSEIFIVEGTEEPENILYF